LTGIVAIHKLAETSELPSLSLPYSAVTAGALRWHSGCLLFDRVRLAVKERQNGKRE
jgi:hypothetical protein